MSDEKRLPLIDWNKILNENTELKAKLDEMNLRFADCVKWRNKAHEAIVERNAEVERLKNQHADELEACADELERLKKEMQRKPQCYAPKKDGTVGMSGCDAEEPNADVCRLCRWIQQNHQDGDKE